METLKKAICSSALNTVVLIITSLIIAWGFVEIRDLPKSYVTKVELRDALRSADEKFDKIDKKLDMVMSIYIDSFPRRK